MNIKNAQKDGKNFKREVDKIPYSKLTDLVKTYIFGIGITNESKSNILKYIIKSIKNSSENYYIVTPNPEMIVASSRKLLLKNVLNGAKIALNDGVGTSIAGKILNKELPERFTGVDMVKELCREVQDWPITVGFLGGGPNVAEMTAECLLSKYPKLHVAFTGQEWSDTYNKKIDILFVALGFPKQELWMEQHINKINVRVMIGVGGAFDYISGKIPLAPKRIRAIGLEWLFRLAVQPWRMKRQLALPVFAFMVMMEKFKQFKR